jgi:PKD repeat protein
MRRLAILICILFCTLTTSLRSQDAPLTTIGSVTNAVAGPVTVPVTVTNFVNIGSVSLTLDYNPAVITYSSAVPHPSLSSAMSLTVVYPGRLTISWFGTGITFPDNTRLVDLTFTYISGTSTLTWYDNGASCQYANGLFVVLNDCPTASYYFNGVITGQAAPVTIAPVVLNATPGTVNVPITANGFTNIATISLTLEYNQFVLTYQTITSHPLLSGGTLSATTAVVNGKMRLTISWFNLEGITLPDGSEMFTIGFNYTTSNGINFSELKWIDQGGSCQYSDGNYNVLYDSPTAQYYKNGLVASKLSPKTYLPVITNATAGALTLPVTVDGFTDQIASITLRFEYDPAVITYAGTFAKNPALNGTMYVGDAPVSGGKRKLSIAWIGTSPGLSNGSYLVNLNFTYASGTTALTWFDNGTSCEYGDLAFQALYDLPQSDYYVNGVVSFGSGPKTIAASVLAIAGNPVHVPITVLDYTNIGTGSLTLDYDPGAITYINAVPHSSIATDFSATLTTPGRITMSWFGPGVTLANNTELIGLNFTYNGGTTPLAWHDNGGSCQYSNGSYLVLYDLPQSTFYINGQVSRMPLDAGFSANNTLPQINETVTFTDLSTGGPLTWTWSFSPSNYNFVNNTNSGSQNPQVQFTANGKYTVTLTVTNAYESSTETKTYYLHVGCNGCWSGLSSTDWYTESNWDNYLVPSILTDVTISPSTKVTYWPDHLGDFTLGTLCKTITLVDNAEMNVQGDFTINPGAGLIVTGSGIFRVGGDWINNGTFNCGTGTVKFIGTGPSLIPPGLGFNTFYNFTVYKDNAAVTNEGNIIVLKDVTIE